MFYQYLYQELFPKQIGDEQMVRSQTTKLIPSENDPEYKPGPKDEYGNLFYVRDMRVAPTQSTT